MAARTNAQDHSNTAKIYKPKNSPAPAPSPTALSQLKNTMSTMMNRPESVTAGSKMDPNIYRGTYGGKDWVWQNGKASRSK
jgi:hypothetical protein